MFSTYELLGITTICDNGCGRMNYAAITVNTVKLICECGSSVMFDHFAFTEGEVKLLNQLFVPPNK